MEATQEEDHVIKSNGEGDSQSIQQGLDNTTNMKGTTHNGEYMCMNEYMLSLLDLIRFPWLQHMT